MPRNYFDFFRLFAEIFDYFGASPVSTTSVSDTFTFLESFTGVNDTGKKLLTGVTGGTVPLRYKSTCGVELEPHTVGLLQPWIFLRGHVLRRIGPEDIVCV